MVNEILKYYHIRRLITLTSDNIKRLSLYMVWVFFTVRSKAYDGDECNGCVHQPVDACRHHRYNLRKVRVWEDRVKSSSWVQSYKLLGTLLT